METDEREAGEKLLDQTDESEGGADDESETAAGAASADKRSKESLKKRCFQFLC
jgi:hypothetical protein